MRLGNPEKSATQARFISHRKSCFGKRIGRALLIVSQSCALQSSADQARRAEQNDSSPASFMWAAFRFSFPTVFNLP